MSQWMNRDEARIWMAQNPFKIIVNSDNVSFRMIPSGIVERWGYHTTGEIWYSIVTGIADDTYTIVEPEELNDDKLVHALQSFRKGTIAYEAAMAIREEITRIADERISKAKVKHGITENDCQIDPLITLIPGDE